MLEVSTKFVSLKIRVPTILDAELNNESTNILSYVNLNLNAHDESNGASDFSEYLDLDKVQHIINFLEEAIHFRDGLEDLDMQQEMISYSYVKALESNEAIERDRPAFLTN